MTVAALRYAAAGVGGGGAGGGWGSRSGGGGIEVEVPRRLAIHPMERERGGERGARMGGEDDMLAGKRGRGGGGHALGAGERGSGRGKEGEREEERKRERGREGEAVRERGREGERESEREREVGMEELLKWREARLAVDQGDYPEAGGETSECMQRDLRMHVKRPPNACKETSESRDVKRSTSLRPRTLVA
jgi:hypothetical protein